MSGPEWSAGQLVDIWHVSCRRSPEARGAPAVHQLEVRHAMRQPLNRWRRSASHCPHVLTTMAECSWAPQQVGVWGCRGDARSQSDWPHSEQQEYEGRYAHSGTPQFGLVSDTTVVWLFRWSNMCDSMHGTSWCQTAQCWILNWHTAVNNCL